MKRARLGASGMAYRKLGTTSQVSACTFCGWKNLSSTTVLKAHRDHGQVIGTAYACAVCAAGAAGPR
jgi:hypothetical protein